MNYEHSNKIHETFKKEIFPYVHNNFNALNFEEYIRRVSFLPSFKWMREVENVKANRILFAVDTKKFLKKYESSCVTYNCPTKPEEGMLRVIYQIDEHIHCDAAVWIWIEQEHVNHYISLYTIQGNVEKYKKFADDLWKIRREGSTEATVAPGFAPVSVRGFGK